MGSREKLIRLAGLNLAAGRKAKATAAFDTALGYFKAGLTVLDETAWDSDYVLTLALHTEACETAYISTDFGYMETLVEASLKHSRSLLDKTKVSEIRILAYIAQNRLIEAVNTALYVLKLLEHPIPQKPGKLRIARELMGIKLALSRRNTEALLELPPMKDPYLLSVMRILASSGIAAYSSVPELVPVFTCRSIDMTLKFGNAPESSMTYIAYGLILCCVISDIEAGYRFGRLGVRLAEAMNTRGSLANAYQLFAAIVLHWKEPVKESYKIYLDAYRIGLETGDIESASYALHNFCSTSYFDGEELNKLEQKMTSSSQTISRLKQSAPLFLNVLYHQAVKNLTVQNENPCRLIGGCYDENKMLPQHLKANDTNLLFNLYFNKLMLCVVMGDAEEAEKYLFGVLGTIAYPIYHFYSTLAWTASYSYENMRKRKQLIKRIKKNIKLMKKWSKHAPGNFLNKYQLMLAEFSRITNNELEAMALYDKAMESRYSEILNTGFSGGHTSITSNSSGTETTSHALDMATIIKASQAISKEIELEALLKKLVRIIFENAGAQKVILILRGEEGYRIEAEGFAEDEINITLKPVSIYGSGKVPESIINYVIRTEEAVVLDDACRPDVNSGRFMGDRYIAESKPRSILCIPITNKGDLAGIVYMENNSISGAFTKDRLEILNILTAQLAISIENASLYRNLKHSEEKYHKLIDNMHDALFIVQRGKICYANSALEKMFGYGIDEICSTDYTAYLTPESVQRIAEEYNIGDDFAALRIASEIEVDIIHKTGQRITAILSTRMVDYLGEQAVQGTLKDITDRKKAEEELRRHKENLEELVNERTLKLTETNKRLELTSANIKSLLNNAGQGFLSFDCSLLVDDEYSSECRRIFRRDIEAAYFPELLYPGDAEQRDMLA